MMLKLINSSSEAGCLKVRLKMKILMVFDFDHTVVDENCDIWVIKYVLKVLLHVIGYKETGYFISVLSVSLLTGDLYFFCFKVSSDADSPRLRGEHIQEGPVD